MQIKTVCDNSIQKTALASYITATTVIHEDSDAASRNKVNTIVKMEKLMKNDIIWHSVRWDDVINEVMISYEYADSEFWWKHGGFNVQEGAAGEYQLSLVYTIVYSAFEG